MRRTSFWALVGATVVTLGLGVSYRTMAAPQSVKIGIVLPLSGSMAEYGANGRNGLILAQEQLAKQRGMPQLQLLYQDTRNAPQDTLSAVRRLIDVDGTRFIIGGLTSSGVLAAESYPKRRGVLFFSPAASAPGIPDGKLIFRNWPPDDAIARKFGDEMYKRGARRIAIASVSNDYGATNANGFTASFVARGGAVPFKRTFPQGTTDFKTLVAELSTQSGVDHVYVVAYPDEYRAFFQELAKSTLKPSVVLVSDTFYSPKFIAEVGSITEGVVCAVAAKPGNDYAPRKRFIDAYTARFHKAPGLVSDTAYDALNLVAAGIAKGGGTPAGVAKYLHSLKNYPGAAGPTTFTADGDVKGDLALYQVKGGSFVRI
jgi:branched-chain amino acid transport system substrate-binding protein